MPELLRQRPLVAQVLMPTLVPAAFGAICGWLLGVSEVAYTILTVLAIAGGYAAGFEHNGRREGAVRGLVGGALFGALMLIVRGAPGQGATGQSREPHIVLVLPRAAFGTGREPLVGGLRADIS